MERGRRAGLVVAGLASFALATFIARHEAPELAQPEPEPASPTAESRDARPAAADERPLTTSAAAPVRQGPEEREATLARIREKLGPDLQAEFGADGRLVGLRGRPGRARKAGSDFRPDDPQKALARAREILDAASGLLGLSPDWPLEQPVAKGGAISAQVYFQQAHEGVGVAPFGSVTVDLDAQGGLLRLTSSYVRDPEIVNSPGLSPAEAKARALAAVETSGRPAAEGGDTVLWISRSPGGRALARYAYDFYVQGRQVVVDASDGRILSRRDRRQY